MSWAEVKKINSDLSTPINIASLINHIDMVGEKYIGYGDIAGTVSILETDAVYAHEIAREILVDLILANAEVLTSVVASPLAINKCLRNVYTSSRITGETQVKDYCESILSASTGVGEWLAFLANSDNADLLACDTIAQVNNSSSGRAVVLSSQSALNAIVASTTGFGTFAIRYGFRRTKADANPATRITYLYDAVGKTPAYMNFTTGEFDNGSWEYFIGQVSRPVMLKTDKTVDYELSRADFTKKADGVTASDISSTSYDGNAMIEFSKWKWVQRDEDATYEYVTFSNTCYNSTYEAYAHENALGTVRDSFYWGAFKGCNVGSKLRSLAGQTIMVNQTRNTEVSYATAIGTGYYTIYKSGWDFINDLLTLISKSDNGQASFGQGRHGASNALATGTLKDKPMFMGYDNATSDVKAFGIEGLWGNVWEGLAGLIFNLKIKVKMTPPYNFDGAGYIDTGIIPSGTSGGYVSSASVTSEAGYVPKVASGSATQYYCDGLWFNNSQVDYALVGGHWYGGLLVGPRSVILNNLASAADATFGSRLSFLDPA